MNDLIDELDRRSLIGFRWAVGGGALSGLLLAGILWAVGSVRPFEADVLVEQFAGALLYFYSAIVGGASTILALMLAVLSFSRQAQKQLTEFHYRRLRAIARIDTAVLVASLIAFVLVGLPLDRMENLTDAWMTWVFYGQVAFSSLVAGTMITVVLALYTAVSETIAVVGLDEDYEHLIRMREARDEEPDTQAADDAA